MAAAAAAMAAVLLWEAPARACGPDFPVDLLADREGTALGLRERVFLEEVAHLVPAPETPYVVDTDDDLARTRGRREERARYDRGARAFEAGDYAAAREAFEAVLALPAAQRHHRSTWAAYMIGRLYDGAQWCDDPCTQADYARVVRPGVDAYRQVRALVAAGFADDLGLAAASLGQEARLHLHAGDTAAAVRLYAEQAAHGHRGGAVSLLAVVRRIVADEAEAQLVGDPVGQRLLAVYLDTRALELTDHQTERLWRSLLDAPVLSAADDLAAAAYRAGKWELAGELARRAPQALMSRWVLGKLALRAGRRDDGQRLLESVAAELDDGARRCRSVDAELASARVHGELAVVSLAEDQPVAAMEHAWQMRDAHPDALYLAERVLSMAELRDFVDAAAGAGAVCEPDEYAWPVVDEASVRGVLARRLMRTGRFAEALGYIEPDHYAAALAYGRAVAMARIARDPIAKATALFEASKVARAHGLEILGTSYGPDWAMYDAAFDLSGWRESTGTGAMTAFERERVAASAPAFDVRYHYRQVAADLAEAAADELPHQSQAFAATLCHAARYVYNTDAARVQALWARYVQHGPTVEFSATFGQSCPPPQIAPARRYLPQSLSGRAPLVLCIGLLVTAAVAGAARVSRRG